MMIESKKIQRTFVREEAYFVLRDWIVAGSLKPNQKLRDTEIAKQLGCSRTPIREALLRLEEDGFVETKPNSSTIVCPIDFQSASNLYSITWSLETLALTQAFEFLSPRPIELMIAANDKLIRALKLKDAASAVDADNEFHAVFIELSQNRELSRILAGIKQKLKRIELFYFEKVQDVHHSCDEHTQVIEALKEKDLQRALGAIVHNWQLSFKRIQELEF